jgi:hypothetical protein
MEETRPMVDLGTRMLGTEQTCLPGQIGQRGFEEGTTTGKPGTYIHEKVTMVTQEKQSGKLTGQPLPGQTLIGQSFTGQPTLTSGEKILPREETTMAKPGIQIGTETKTVI